MSAKEYEHVTTVSAYQLDEPQSIPTSSGAVQGNKGDYVCKWEDDTVSVESKNEFEEYWKEKKSNTKK